MLISGTSTALDWLIPNKFLDPLEPALILPEVKESKYWRGGAPEFLDPGHQTLIMTLMHRETLYVNSNLVTAVSARPDWLVSMSYPWYICTENCSG